MAGNTKAQSAQQSTWIPIRSQRTGIPDTWLYSWGGFVLWAGLQQSETRTTMSQTLSMAHSCKSSSLQCTWNMRPSPTVSLSLCMLVPFALNTFASIPWHLYIYKFICKDRDPQTRKSLGYLSLKSLAITISSCIHFPAKDELPSSWMKMWFLYKQNFLFPLLCCWT